MQVLTVERTNIWKIDRHGGGLAYEIVRLPSNAHDSDRRSVWLQGDEALGWEREWEAMRAAYTNPTSVWWRRSWDACLTSICEDYFAD